MDHHHRRRQPAAPLGVVVGGFCFDVVAEVEVNKVLRPLVEQEVVELVETVQMHQRLHLRLLDKLLQ